MTKTKDPILFDVDGVFADFVTKTVNFVNNRFKTAYRAQDVHCDVRKYMVEWDDACEAHVASEGFASDLELHNGGPELIAELMKNHKVLFVTSPYKDSKTWGYDRQKWLEKHFGITRDDVIYCHDKRYVQGITLIDDLPKNCINWANHHDKKSILVDRPWNRNDEIPENVLRVKEEDLKEAIDELIKSIK